ncbi:geranylgeranyl transferase type2 beta subunit, putative [Plasmodium malariae]|uniref:Geranylgeranyl transferase type II subunit beta n=1 Tax=Plasmodium malariae TaxID=5858 RepID=A0A1C3L2N2_PLAMA|nr:geranylgeranyl transferase type2 beta subunit, putative [Plasmodium malariae]
MDYNMYGLLNEELDLNLHEKYFLNTITEKLGKTYNESRSSNKYESLFLSGVFWVLSGLSIINKDRRNLNEVLDNNIIELIYILVMQCLEKKKIKEKYIYNLKKEKYLLSNEDVHNIINTSKYDNNFDKKSFTKRKKLERTRIIHDSTEKNCSEKVKNINNIDIDSEENSSKMREPKHSKLINDGEETTSKKRPFSKINVKLNKSMNNLSCSEKKKKKKKFIVRGFSPCNKKFLYEANVISTLSAIQILFLLNKTSEDDISTKILLEIYNFIYFIFDADRGFFYFSLNSLRYRFDGDMRFMFCSLSILYFIKLLLKKRNINIHIYKYKEKCTQWISSCFNIDGGFSSLPGSESHAGTTFCAISSLNLLKGKSYENYFLENRLLKRRLIRWLCDRYENFGINGRVGKDHDVCYAWWVLGSLVSLKTNLSELFNVNILINFILKCQDRNNGGFSRVEQNENNFKKENFNYYQEEQLTYKETDPFHTFFSLCALSLIYYNVNYYKKKAKRKCVLYDNAVFPQYFEHVLRRLKHIHESFAMPIDMIKNPL